MRRIAFGQAAAILVGALASPVSAAPAGPQLWQVDWEQEHCTIATGDPASIYLALWMTPGDPEPEIYLVAPADRLRGGGDTVTLTLPPAAETIRASAVTVGSDTTLRRVAIHDFFGCKESRSLTIWV